jgi:uncharacterized protein (TIGR03435 family)
MKPLLLLTLTLTSLLPAQPATSPTFEVASIKPPHHSDRYIPRTGSITDPSTLIRLENWTLFGLIHEAWKLHDYQIRFHPSIKGETVADDLYDIVARAPGSTIPKPDDARTMLRNLLLERFRMQTHLETKEASVYALTVSKNGAKLIPAKSESDSTPPCTTTRTPGIETFTNCPLDRLADRLANILGNQTPVLNQTNLTGLFDFRLATDSDPDPSTALARLGLTLIRQNARIELLVIDHFETPTQN